VRRDFVARREVEVPVPPSPEEVGKRLGQLIATMIRIAPPHVALRVVKVASDELYKAMDEVLKDIAREVEKGPPGAR